MKPPHIVAEIGGNHLGSLNRALELVEAAKEAGADSVKVQCWSEMSVCEKIIPSGPWRGRTLPQLYAETKMPWGWVSKIFAHCNLLGMEGFSSVFDMRALSFLELLHCPKYKIASFEITDLPLIRAAAATGKPLILSTGMATSVEIIDAVAAARAAGCTDLTLLKCTSAYPAGAADANLATMGVLCHDAKHGVSDHTLGLAVPVAATTLGATMIEKHLTIERADGGPDAAFSAEPDEFGAMVKACREAASAIGLVRFGPTEAEAESLQFRRGLWITRDLHAGELLTEDNLRSMRPASWIAPHRIGEFMGKRVTGALSRGTALQEKHVSAHS